MADTTTTGAAKFAVGARVTCTGGAKGVVMKVVRQANGWVYEVNRDAPGTYLEAQLKALPAGSGGKK